MGALVASPGDELRRRLGAGAARSAARARARNNAAALQSHVQPPRKRQQIPRPVRLTPHEVKVLTNLFKNLQISSWNPQKMKKSKLKEMKKAKLPIWTNIPNISIDGGQRTLTIGVWKGTEITSKMISKDSFKKIEKGYHKRAGTYWELMANDKNAYYLRIPPADNIFKPGEPIRRESDKTQIISISSNWLTNFSAELPLSVSVYT